MASKDCIKNIIAGIKGIYSYYLKDGNAQITGNLWLMVLEDYPDDIVEIAFKQALKTCKMPPTPADVIENINAMVKATGPTDEELWSSLTQVLPKVRDYIDEIRYKVYGDPVTPHEKIKRVYDKLPPKIQIYLGSPNELKVIAQYSNEDLKFEKVRFLKAIKDIKRKEEFSMMLGPGSTLIPKQIGV